MCRNFLFSAALACSAFVLIAANALLAQGAFIEQSGLVVVEVESVSPATGWVSETAQTGFTGTSYYKWMGGDKLSSPGSGILEYKIKINNPGVFRFEWHNKIGNGSSTTDCNDTWMKITDAADFYAQDGSTVKHPHGDCTNDCPEGAGSGGWFKLFSSGTTAWTWSTHTNDGGAGYFIYARFDAAGIYTVQISGRSDYHCVDRFVLYQVGVAVNPTSLTQPQSSREGTALLHVPRHAVTFVATQPGEHLLRVCTLDGKTVFTAPLKVTERGMVTIPFSRNLVRGTYVTQIEGDDLSVCRRVTVCR